MDPVTTTLAQPPATTTDTPTFTAAQTRLMAGVCEYIHDYWETWRIAHPEEAAEMLRQAGEARG